MNTPPELAIVMPVFNEEASVRKVAKEWFEEVGCWEEKFLFLAIDDGSTDRTPTILDNLRGQLGDRFQCFRKTNTGHGQSCLFGYRKAAELGVKWIIQIDSDGQCDPQYFHRLWRLRFANDIVYGMRKRRDDGWRRLVASFILRWALFMRFGTLIRDANVPYRLMRTEAITSLVERVPASFHLANIALAYLCAKANLRIQHVPIHFSERYGGEPKVPIRKFASKAMELFHELGEL